MNECDDGRNGDCVRNSKCINTLGSFRCGECIEGFYGNQTIGCHRKEAQTICPDGTVCHQNAFCVKRKGFVNYVCQCNIGWAGDGKICGEDSDLDGWCDYQLSCPDKRCQKDNCPNLPNSGQEDSDNDGIGDICDEDADNDGIPNKDVSNDTF